MTPTSLEAYEERFCENARTEHRDGEDCICFPCPFCASRDWYVVAAAEALHSTRAIYCIECERSGRFVAKDDQLELVQIAGPPPPEWLPEIRHENPVTRIVSAGRLPDPKPGRHALRAKPTPPPNLHRTTSTVRNCHMCEYIDRETGVCRKYNWNVERDEVCDSFEIRS